MAGGTETLGIGSPPAQAVTRDQRLKAGLEPPALWGTTVCPGLQWGLPAQGLQLWSHVPGRALCQRQGCREKMAAFVPCVM